MAPDPVLCVFHSDAEPLVSLLTNWESLVGETFGYYDSSAVAMVTARINDDEEASITLENATRKAE